MRHFAQELEFNFESDELSIDQKVCRLVQVRFLAEDNGSQMLLDAWCPETQTELDIMDFPAAEVKRMEKMAQSTYEKWVSRCS